MKTKRSKIKETGKSTQTWVQYRPPCADEPSPSFEDLWNAIRGYTGAITVKKNGNAIEVPFQNLQQVTLGMQQRFPAWGIRVQAHGREVIPSDIEETLPYLTSPAH